MERKWRSILTSEQERSILDVTKERSEKYDD